MENRYLTIIYIACFGLLSLVFAKTVNLIWEVTEFPGIDVVPNELSLGTLIGVLLGLVVTLILWANRPAHQYLTEVVDELAKVDWPSWKDTQKSTLIVIVFAIVLGAYLFVIDKIWSLLTNYILVS